MAPEERFEGAIELLEGRLFIVDGMTSSEGKTKDIAKKLKDFGLSKGVLVDAKSDAKFKRASGNLPKFRYYGVEGLNVYDLLKYDNVLLTKESVATIVEILGEK